MNLCLDNLAILNQDKKQVNEHYIQEGEHKLTDGQLLTETTVNLYATKNPKAKLYQCPDSRFITYSAWTGLNTGATL
ncbi:hypothetical protein HanXRQr2_Chr08g0357021 [Helianthus annuus]|uniref:Uncharacterized protein n=1 Tax=Helianthus annuus TaxID=4232 RepID=A0A9K3IHD2_HELAN|nr:hypothetical protein HanXRQr2_Chr08g0357021 [Helianthus annuus]KAJ0540135.1 hypothetical protein HanHA300_Chr08g0294781 [Helianthus annuus]